MDGNTSPRSFEGLALNSSPLRKLFQCLTNLLRVAWKIRNSYNAIRSFGLLSSFLSCVGQSFRFDFVLAIFPSTFVCLKVEEYEKNGISCMYWTFCHQAFNGKSVNDLLPPRSKQKFNFLKWDLSLINEEYSSQHISRITTTINAQIIGSRREEQVSRLRQILTNFSLKSWHYGIA